MSPNGFGERQPSHDLSPDERLNLLIQQSQHMQREAMQAQMQVPPLPVADIVVHQGDQQPRETVGEWNPISSLAQGMVPLSVEGPPSACRAKALADKRANGATTTAIASISSDIRSDILLPRTHSTSNYSAECSAILR